MQFKFKKTKNEIILYYKEKGKKSWAIWIRVPDVLTTNFDKIKIK